MANRLKNDRRLRSSRGLPLLTRPRGSRLFGPERLLSYGAYDSSRPQHQSPAQCHHGITMPDRTTQVPLSPRPVLYGRTKRRRGQAKQQAALSAGDSSGRQPREAEHRAPASSTGPLGAACPREQQTRKSKRCLSRFHLLAPRPVARPCRRRSERCKQASCPHPTNQNAARDQT
jgi:hypothetical protein